MWKQPVALSFKSCGWSCTWPYLCMALFVHGPICAWPYLCMALFVHGPMCAWPYLWLLCLYAASTLTTCCNTIKRYSCRVSVLLLLSTLLQHKQTPWLRVSVLLPPSTPVTTQSHFMAAASASCFYPHDVLPLNQMLWLLRQRAASALNTCCNTINLHGCVSACCCCSQHLLRLNQTPWLRISVLLLLSTPAATQSHFMAAASACCFHLHDLLQCDQNQWLPCQRATSAFNTCCDSIKLHGCCVSVLLPPARPAAMRSKSVAAMSACCQINQRAAK